jgi:hypothetical protein
MGSSEKGSVSLSEDYPPETIAGMQTSVTDFLYTLAWSACLVSASDALTRPGSHVYPVKRVNVNSTAVAFPAEAAGGGPLAPVWRKDVLPKLIEALKDSLAMVSMYPADRHDLVTGAYFLKAPKFARNRPGMCDFPWAPLVSIDGTDAFLAETLSVLRAAAQRNPDVGFL